MGRAVLSAGAVALLMLSAFCGMQIVNDSGSGEPLGGTAGPLTWTIENGFTLSISGTGAMPNYSSAAPPWAEYSSTIETIVVGERVTQIGVNAFADMVNVESVSLPETLTLIGNAAFKGCTSLTSVAIPDSVTSPGRNTFQNCTALTTAVFGDGAQWIGQYCFDGCTALESVTVGSSVVSLGDYTFQNCVSLSEINVPEGVTSIGQYCFQNCTALAHVDLPSTLQEIKYGGFMGSGLTEIVLPDSCSEIWKYSFKNCISLRHVTYPDSITYIGIENFMGCTALETFEFGDSVTEIRNNAFSGCTSLRDAWLPESLQTIGVNSFKNCTSLTDVILYENVTSLGNYAFQNCSSLAEVTLGSNVSTFGTQVFRDCTALATVYNASDLEITPNTTDHGYVARYAEEIVPVTPAEASYRASDADYAVQTVYVSGEDVSFRIRPADPERDGYAFDGWSYGSQKAGRYDIVTLPADAIELTATWASLTISAEADDQETLTEIPVSYAVTVSGEGDMVMSVESCTGGEAVLDGNVIHFTPSSTDSTVTAVIVVHITNGHASTDVTTEVLVDPVLEFTADVTEGTLEASE